jgi:hypothetical protein
VQMLVLGERGTPCVVVWCVMLLRSRCCLYARAGLCVESLFFAAECSRTRAQVASHPHAHSSHLAPRLSCARSPWLFFGDAPLHGAERHRMHVI